LIKSALIAGSCWLYRFIGFKQQLRKVWRKGTQVLSLLLFVS
jgi:hypothetical protein